MGLRVLRSELVSIIKRRNEIASYLMQTTLRLPDVKKNINACKSCHQLKTCMLYHKASENGTSKSSGLGESCCVSLLAQ